MTFTATLESVQQPGNLAVIELNVKYTDTDLPDWHVQKTLPITIVPGLTQAAVRNQVIADARLYQAQNAVYAALKSLEGQSIPITPA